jgi:hypothetical protein
VLSYVLFDCVVLCIVMCVNVYYCHRVSTQLQLNISYHIIATSYGLDFPRFKSVRCNRFSLLQNRSNRLWGPYSLLFNEYQVPFPGIKQPRREVDSSPLYCTEIKNDWSYTSVLPICLRGVDKQNSTFLVP